MRKVSCEIEEREYKIKENKKIIRSLDLELDKYAKVCDLNRYIRQRNDRLAQCALQGFEDDIPF